MKLDSRLTVLGSALACGAVLSPAVQAGGISLYELGTPDVGLASAGYAARAQDASTLFKNPAGMSLLTSSQLQAGAQVLYGSTQFSPDSNTSLRLGHGDGGNAIGLLPGASLFYVQNLSERWKVGVGTFSNFGLMSKYDNDWLGRYYVQEGSLVGVSLMPAVSFKATDWLSIGAGMNAMYGYLNNKVAVNNVLGPDGQMSLKDETWGFGANVGVLVEPVKGTRLGLTYQSPIELDFKDTPKFTGLGPGFGALLQNPPQLDLGVTVPQSVMFSAYQELGRKWAIMANVGWQNWHQFGQVDVGVDSANPQSLTTDLNYQDTWHGALGAQYRPSEKWQFSGGLAFDSSAVSDANRAVALPMGEAWRIGLGAEWQVNKAVNLGAAYEFMWGGDMPVDQGSDLSLRGRVSGGYNDSWFSFFTLNLTWRF